MNKREEEKVLYKSIYTLHTVASKLGYKFPETLIASKILLNAGSHLMNKTPIWESAVELLYREKKWEFPE